MIEAINFLGKDLVVPYSYQQKADSNPWYICVRILACLQHRENLPLFQHVLEVMQSRRLRLARSLVEKGHIQEIAPVVTVAVAEQASAAV